MVFIPPAALFHGRLALIPRPPGLILFAIFWALSACGIIYALVRRRPERIAVSVGIIAYLSMYYIFGMAMPAFEIYRPEKSFAAVVRDEVGPDLGRLGFYRNLETFFYLNSPNPLPEYDNPWALRKAIKNGRINWLLIRESDEKKLGINGNLVASEVTYPWQPPKKASDRIVLFKLAPPDTSSQS
jgi:hypothetical protein